MPRSSKGPSTSLEVDSFAAANLYQILQTKSIYLSLHNNNPCDQKLLSSYADWFWGSTRVWTRKFGVKTRREQAKRFYSALRRWLEERNLFRYRFAHLEKMMFLEGVDCLELCAQPVACPVNCSWESCPNAQDIRECDDSCESPDKCDNQPSLTPFVWSELMEVRYIDTKTGLGLFAKEALSAYTFLGEFLGEAVTQVEFEKRNQEPLRHSFMLFVGEKCFHGIDPTDYGNYTRFINHSCRPNCVAETWLSQGQWKVFFHTLRKVPKVRIKIRIGCDHL